MYWSKYELCNFGGFQVHQPRVGGGLTPLDVGLRWCFVKTAYMYCFVKTVAQLGVVVTLATELAVANTNG